MSLSLMCFARKHKTTFVNSCSNVQPGSNNKTTKALWLALLKIIKVYKGSVEIKGGHSALLANIEYNNAVKIEIYKILPYILPCWLATQSKFILDKFVPSDTVSILFHTIKTKIPRNARYLCF